MRVLLVERGVAEGARLALDRLYRGDTFLLLGDRVKAPEAVAMGLASRRFAPAALHAEAVAFAVALAQRAPVPLRLGKAHLNAGLIRDYDTALVAEREAVLACMMTEDWKEGVRSFAEKRKPVYTGR